MSVTVVVGGQYGSEGKGKVVALEAALCDEPWVVRCGGPNSGHTTSVNGVERVLRQLPAAAGHPGATLLLAAGCAIDLDVLLSEIESCEIPRERLVIDPRAVLVTPEDRDEERRLRQNIASTGSGTGAALARRMMRGAGVGLVGNNGEVRSRARIEPVAPLLQEQIDQGARAIVEGTQGFGLSLFHGPDYPYVTSRDTTAAAFASEVGLSARDISEIIVVVRTFPIRVGGNSGPLQCETDWEEIRHLSGADELHLEFTSVTNKLRRVAHFDIHMVEQAVRYNGASALAVMGLDRLDARLTGCREKASLTDLACEFLKKLSRSLGIPVRWAGTGFGTFDVICDPLLLAADVQSSISTSTKGG